MYVCICKAVTERDIHEAVTEGCYSMRHLRQSLGVCSGCGRCGHSALEVLRCALGGNAEPASDGLAPVMSLA
jgi:bacterioferritin-associated ferredoxin